MPTLWFYFDKTLCHSRTLFIILPCLNSSIKVANVWIRTVVFCCWKHSLCQLYHNLLTTAPKVVCPLTFWHIHWGAKFSSAQFFIMSKFLFMEILSAVAVIYHPNWGHENMLDHDWKSCENSSQNKKKTRKKKDGGSEARRNLLKF